MLGYTVREVARALGMTERQVRSFARSGLVEPGRGPRNEYRFSFRDLVVLRAASELTTARLHPRTVRRAMRKLREQLPEGRSLAELRIETEGEEIVVRERDTLWNPHSGQTVLGFSVADVAAQTASLLPRIASEEIDPDTDDPEEWYNLACDLEAVSPEEAERAYRRAIELDPEYIDALINLGHLAHAAGRTEEAELLFRRTIEVDPDHPVGWYNLGVALEDRGRRKEAVAAYLEAVRLSPGHASAHFNLSRLYEGMGAKAHAIRHLAEYRRFRRNEEA